MAQLGLDDPFLRAAPSPESNAMGGISSTLITENALATSYNPGHLGLFALTHSLNAGMYLSAPQLYYSGAFQNPLYNALAGNIGFNLGNLLHTQVPLSLGLGYAKSFLTELKWKYRGQFEPSIFEQSATAQTISLGFAIDYIIRFGMGINYKYINSTTYVTGSNRPLAVATAPAWDWGLILEVPLVRIISLPVKLEDQTTPSSKPFLNIITAYNLQNVGHGFEAEYISDFYPLPREATLGLSVRLGVISHTEQYDWEYISLIAVREANDLLARWPPQDTTFGVNGPGTFVVNDPHPEYEGLTGAIQFFKNVIMGQSNGKVEIRNGLQVNLGDVLYIRAGSIENAMESVSTSGFGLHVSGMLKLIDQFNPSWVSEGACKFLFKHVDIQFDYAHFNSSQLSRDNTTFESLNIILK